MCQWKTNIQRPPKVQLTTSKSIGLSCILYFLPLASCIQSCISCLLFELLGFNHRADASWTLALETQCNSFAYYFLYLFYVIDRIFIFISYNNKPFKKTAMTQESYKYSQIMKIITSLRLVCLCFNPSCPRVGQDSVQLPL